MRRPDGNALAAVALGRARARLCATDIQNYGRRWRPGDELPAVDIPLEIAGTGEQGRRHEIQHPTPHAHAVWKPLRPRRRRSLAGVAGQRLLVDVGDVRQIQQIVDDELVVRAHLNGAGGDRPLAICEPGQWRDLVRIGERRITHPDPQYAPSFVDRIASDLRSRRHLHLPGNKNASSARVELKPVIAAGQVLALNLAARQRRRAMAALIRQGGWPAACRAEQDDLLVQEDFRQGCIGEVIRPCCGVPAIAKKHGATPRALPTAAPMTMGAIQAFLIKGSKHCSMKLCRPFFARQNFPNPPPTFAELLQSGSCCLNRRESSTRKLASRLSADHLEDVSGVREARNSSARGTCSSR